MDWSPEICLTPGKMLCDARVRACVCVSTLGSCQSCFEVTFYHLCFARQLRHTFVKSKRLVSRGMTFGMSGLIRSLAPGDTRWERVKEVEVELRGINEKNKNNIAVFYCRKYFIFFTWLNKYVLCCWLVSGRFLTIILEVMTVYAVVLNW